MELAIHRREDIAIKHHHKNNKQMVVGNDGSSRLSQHQERSNSSITKGELEKRIECETSKLKKIERCIQEANESVANARKELDAMRIVLTAAKEQPTLCPHLNGTSMA